MITLTTPITFASSFQTGTVTVTGVRISDISGDPDQSNYALQLEAHGASGVVALGPGITTLWVLGAAGKAAFSANVANGFRSALYAALQADSPIFAGTVT